MTPQPGPAPIPEALASIPMGWNVAVEWFTDDYPCVCVTLHRNFGRVKVQGHGHSADLGEAMVAAVREAVTAALAIQPD